MTSGEASISKSSTSGQSFEKDGHKSSTKTNVIDEIFPLYDQVFQKVNFPVWFSTLADIFISFQVLMTGLWVYADPYSRTSGIWKDIYKYILLITAFHDPLDFSRYHIKTAYVCFCVAVACVVWIVLMTVIIKKYFMVSCVSLYLTVLLIDIVSPIFMIPSAYVASHGLSMMHKVKDIKIYSQIVLGIVSFCIILSFFLMSTKLKSKSVIFTTLTFQCYDYIAVNTWFATTSILCIINGAINAMHDYYHIIIALIHFVIALLLCYRLMFIPFYNLWRNPICFQFAMLTSMLDINLIVYYIFPHLTYNYTIIIFVVVAIVSGIIGKIVFHFRFKSIESKLNEILGEDEMKEYYDNLNISTSSTKAMMFIVVGMAKMCKNFVNGSLLDYIIHNCDNEFTLSLALQVVTYIPSDTYRLNIICKKLLSKRKLSFVNRFLVYQISKIKSRRLVSSSKDTLEVLNKLKKMNDECKYEINSFWDKASCGDDFLAKLSYSSRKLQKMFDYYIENNPNNTKIASEYANFLVECQCEYDKAIFQMMKIESLIDGKNLNVDTSFRNFVKNFPRYIKEKIYDIHGKNIVKKEEESGGFTISTDKPTSDVQSSVEMPEIVDVESEEILGSKLLRESKVRITLNRNLHEHKPKQLLWIFSFNVISFIIIVSFLISFHFYSDTKLIWKKDAHSDIMNLGYSVFYWLESTYYIILQWAYDAEKYSENYDFLGDLSTDKFDVSLVVLIDLYLNEAIYYSVDQSRKFMGVLLDSMETKADDINVYELSTHLLDSDSELIECHDGQKGKSFKSSLKEQLSLLTFESNVIAGLYTDYYYIENIYQNDDYGEIMLNTFPVIDNSNSVFQNMINYNMKKAKSNRLIFKIIMILGSLAICVFSFLPLLLTSISYFKMVKNVLHIMINLPNRVKEEAKSPLTYHNEDSSEETYSHTTKRSSNIFVLLIASCLIAALIIACFVLLCKDSIDCERDTTNLLFWYYLSTRIMIVMNSIGNNAIQVILLDGEYENNFIQVDELIKRIEIELKELGETLELLTNGDGKDVQGCIGFDEILDKLQIENLCELEENPNNVHDSYACANYIQQYTMFMSIVKDVIKNKEMFNGTLDSEWAMNLLHILEYHLYPISTDFTDRIEVLIGKEYKQWKRNGILILCISMFFAVIFFFLPIGYMKIINENYKMLLVLIQHLHPQHIIDSKELMGFLTNMNNKRTEKMTISKSIVFGTSESIVITNISGIVEIINPSFMGNTGLKPDQIVGQNIDSIIATQDKNKIHEQIELISTDQGSPIWEDHISIINDSNDLVPFHVTMIGIKDQNETSFVFIMSNETEEKKKREEAEIAKAKSEKLLYQILPKDIVMRLNRGEKDITFTIPQATIFFIDIVKFSAYTQSLTPSEIMSNLSEVFQSFDRIVSKYETITKIKLIGDVYMAAAGLFSSENTQQAQESVMCCLDCLNDMEEINTRLESSLEVRIGVNTGGSLIGGVLGTDKPTFDIIGDPINIAARLQSTDILGNVQISEETKKQIEHLDLIIEERGHVYLKGKGNQATYFVKHPLHARQPETLSFISGTL